MALLVRQYQPQDRQALQMIGADTAFFGAPIEAFLDDRRVFMDAFYSYYTDYEPQHAWVACEDERVVGFLTGCTNTGIHDRIMGQKIIPRVFWKWVRGFYHTGKKTARYAWAILGAEIRGEIPGADHTKYPAHLHINLLPAWRGVGLGRKLIEAYIQQLEALQVPGVYLQTTTMNGAAIKLYEKVGFHLLASKPTRMYAHLVDVPVENCCYAMQLPRRNV